MHARRRHSRLGIVVNSAAIRSLVLLLIFGLAGCSNERTPEIKMDDPRSELDRLRAENEQLMERFAAAQDAEQKALSEANNDFKKAGNEMNTTLSNLVDEYKRRIVLYKERIVLLQVRQDIEPSDRERMVRELAHEIEELERLCRAINGQQ